MLHWLLSAALVAVGCLLSATAANADVGVGDRAAELVAAKDSRNQRVTLKSYRKKVVVITFGASWCKPCKKELPEWDKLARTYKGEAVFLAVNIDRDLSKGKAFIKQARLQTMKPLYEPTGATVERYDPPTMPTTYVIDRRGIVRFVHAGYRAGDEKQLKKHIDRLLNR